METRYDARLPGTPQGVRDLRREMSELATDCGMDAEPSSTCAASAT
jgi:hypothetical protein